MAGINFSAAKGRWRVTWYGGDGSRTERLFKSEQDAQRFVDELGDPDRRRGRRRRTRAEVINRLAANFVIDDEGCWVWQGSLTNAGYGRMSWKADGHVSVPGAHRVVLAAIGDEMPSGLVVDHLCRNRACINPDHLEMVSQRENVMRSPIAYGAINAAKTHCANGHPYSDENTRRYYGLGGRKTWVRICKTCDTERQLRRREAVPA